MPVGYAEGGYRQALREASRVLEARQVCDIGLSLQQHDYDKALGCLKQEVDSRNPDAPEHNAVPIWDPVRADPRFSVPAHPHASADMTRDRRSPKDDHGDHRPIRPKAV